MIGRVWRTLLFRRQGEQSRSLFAELLDWVLAPLLILWPMSLALTWAVAQDIANKPYDAELSRLAMSMAQAAAPLPAANAQAQALYALALERIAANRLVRAEEEQLRWYQVRGTRDEVLAGEASLKPPQQDRVFDGLARVREDTLNGETVRVAAVWIRTDGSTSANVANTGAGPEGASEQLARTGGMLVQLAETLEQRQKLTNDIIKGVLLPQFLILPLEILLIWLALSRAFRPLNRLQARIRLRRSTDLSPIPQRDVPEEVAPLVASINELLARLGKSMATQRQFLADAAHQLKTPLAGLRMQAELAARELEQGKGDARAAQHSLRQIAVSTQRAAHTVNQLLSMARTEGAGQALNTQWIDAAALTRGVVRDFVPQALERHIDLGYEGADSACLQAEPVLLGEMLRNLVDNALRYTPSGGVVTVRVHADEAGQARPACITFQVEDSGPGIVAAERELVFEPFYRSADVQDIQGSGLGLAIVREVVQRHGASMSLQEARPRPSAEPGLGQAGPGALFTLVFACGQPSGVAAVAAATAARANAVPRDERA